MEDLSDSKWPRYFILIGVIAFHAALVSVLLFATRYPISSPSPTDYIELLVLPPNAPPKSRLLSAVVGPPDRHLPPLPSDTLTIVVPLPASPANDAGRRDVDWREEVHRTAETAANDTSAFPPATGQNSTSSLGSSWFPEPQHHAGEQYQLDSGNWAVWVNGHCYQVSEWVPRPGGSLNSLPTTNCPQPSKTPRDDLFKDLHAQ